MIFVKFTIDYGGYEYFDYAWFKDYGEAHYENGESITDKDIIQEVYGEGRSDEDFEENFNKETKKILQSKDSKLTIDNQIILGLQSNAYINSVLY